LLGTHPKYCAIPEMPFKYRVRLMADSRQEVAPQDLVRKLKNIIHFVTFLKDLDLTSFPRRMHWKDSMILVLFILCVMVELLFRR